MHWNDELRRRGVLRTAAIYIVGAWLVFQVADVFFPAWNIPDTALRYLLLAAMLGFPIALFLGWRYDITTRGIRLTPPAGDDHVVRGLGRRDYLALAIVLVAVAAIVYSVGGGILASRTEGPGRAEVGGGPQVIERLPNSVAVLPFANISDDPSNDYFCDGVSEEILHRLSDYPELTVMARSSSHAFKGADLEARSIADRLRVEYLLQGSVRKSGEDLRIAASLVDANGVQVWSRAFDRKMQDVFVIQSEIAATVAGNLVATVIEPGELGPRYQPPVEAYEQFLVGREFVRKRVPGWQVRAIEHFDRAIELDPAYAAPHAGRAVAIYLGRDVRAAARYEEAQDSVDKALQLDPNDPDALAAQGLLHQHMREPIKAEASLRRALALDPNVAGARVWLFNVLFVQGREDEAEAVRAEALRRDPFEPRLASGAATRHAERGQFAQAEQIYLRLMELPQPPEVAFSGLNGLYQGYGRYVDLIQTTQRYILARATEGPEPHLQYAYLAHAYAQLGLHDRADYWHDLAASKLPVDLRIQFLRGYSLRLRGEFQQTYELIQSAVAATGAPVERLSGFVQHIFGAVSVASGDYERGIALLEPLFQPDQELAGGFQALDLLQILALGYQETGQGERAGQVLQHIERSVLKRQARGYAQEPLIWFALAQNRVMQNRPEEALATLARAVDRGFRVEGILLHDPRWDPVREAPAFQAALQRVRDDLAAQRSDLETRQAGVSFSVQLERTLAGARSAVSTGLE
jgi:TolB-like protein/tetratricopeptide (TPR) repeat protein